MKIRVLQAQAVVIRNCNNVNACKQVLCEEVGESPLEVLSKLSTEVVLPLLRHQLKKGGSYPDATAVEVSDALQSFASDGMPACTYAHSPNLIRAC